MSNKVDFPKLHEIPTSVEFGWEILESIKKSPKTKGINEELITKLNYVLGRLNASIERYEIKYHYHTNIEKGTVEAIDSLERLRLFETLAMYKAVERRFKIENKKGNSIQKKTYKQLQLSDELFEKIDISKTSEYLDPVLEVELSATIKYIDKKIEDARIKIVKAAGNKNRNIALSNLNSLLLLRKNVNAIYEKESKKELLSKEVVLKKKKY